jgi:hypothetical protein
MHNADVPSSEQTIGQYIGRLACARGHNALVALMALPRKRPIELEPNSPWRG